MRTKEQNDKMIKDAIKEAMEDFSVHPFDWTVREIEAQVRFYNILRKMLSETTANDMKNTIIINRQEKSNSFPIPAYINMKASCLRLEYEIMDIKNCKTRKPDICILKQDIVDVDKKELIDPVGQLLDCFIEIKTAWGYSPSQFNGEGILKDLEFISLYPSIGYLVYFIGNEYKEMKKKGYIEFYRTAMKTNTQALNFNAHQVFIVFRDVVVNGDFEEISLQN